MTELTLDQALQKGVEAHKAGKAQEADRYYTAILKANPKHPDANHNMGVLAVGVGKVEAALPFFKTALETNPNIAQYWLSYIDALIKLDQITDAKTVLDQAKSKGVQGDGFDQIEKRLGLSDTKNSNDQDPPQEQLQGLINLYTQGQYQETLTRASKLLYEFTNSATLYNLMGAANQGIGKREEAVEAFKKATKIEPDYAGAYNNMGVALKEQGKFNKAMEAFKKAIKIKPDYAEAYNNTGNAFKDQGKLDEAMDAFHNALSIKADYSDAYNNLGSIYKTKGKLKKATEAYKKAIKIKPDYPDAYNNLGITLHEQGRLGGAIAAYKKVIKLQPNYHEAYNNMGSTLYEQGNLEEAVESFGKELTRNPNAVKCWNNIYFPLQALKIQRGFGGTLSTLYPKERKSNYAKIAKSILDYRLHRGQESEGQCFDQALSNLSKADNITIQNPTYDKNQTEQMHTLPDKMIALVHFGRSGTGLIHSLIDGHPEVSTLPSIYFSEYFDHSSWAKIISTGWNGMIDRFISIYDVLFDASSSTPVATKSTKLLHNIGIEEGMANVGERKSEVLSINKKVFRSELHRLMAFYEELDASIFFKLVHAAFDKALKDPNPKSLIFYHIHNPDNYALLNFSRFNPNAKWIMMVREPIQSYESWALNKFINKDYFGVASRIATMLFEIDNYVYSNQNCIGVRLEDLKEHPHKTIPALCNWMGIEEDDSLYEMTAQGKKWWGDPSSPDYSKDGMDPFGKTSINRKVGSIFSQNDRFILRTLFYPFSVRFGYAEEDEEQFKADLQTVKPLLDLMFDFEKSLVEQTKVNPDNFVKSGSYLYLRSCLKERWNTLNQFQTYPNMINPLQI